MLNILSSWQKNPSSKIRYLVPFQWWSQIQEDNRALKNFHDLQIKHSPNISHQVQTIHSSEKQQILKLVAQKISFLEIDNFIFNPKLKSGSKWKLICKQVYDNIKSKMSHTTVLPLVFLGQNQNCSSDFFIAENQQFKLIKLLFCSSNQNHLFYGYVDQKIQLKQFIKELISFEQYFYNHQTRITFVETNQFVNYIFQDKSIDACHEKELIMIHGLERYDENSLEPPEQIQYRNALPSYFMKNFQNPRIPRNGEELTMADEDSLTLSDHTMSTGAQTPFTFAIQDQDWDLYRPFQNYGLFGQKLSEQIEHMNDYAREAIYSDIIDCPIFKEEIMVMQLQKLAEDLEQNIYKRKMYQKELAKDNKQFYKQGKECNIYLHHFRERQNGLHWKEKQTQSNCSKNGSLGKEGKEQEQGGSKIGQCGEQIAVRKVYFRKGEENN